ncbi:MULTISPECIES: hypothetical protein [Pseudomonas]|uniref:hypothetical protein n=1 Tax=Pseudomonas TaxID=286 RepID=UPI001071015C|nr:MULTISPECIES: hypothetical protein [Pseudomonas]QBR31867.1 hypothetical protein E3Z29_15630 [Pseudomonas sp. S150]UZT95395.1 hypothetical protein OPS05_12750 [Pseudomonas koreensis]
MIELGQKAEDKITGFYGVITARSQQLNGPDQYRLQPPCSKNNNTLLQAEWFDEERIRPLFDRGQRRA